MPITFRLATLIGLTLSIIVASPRSQCRSWAAETDRAGVEFFEKFIRPVLVQKCYECHAADAEPIMGDLRLDHRDRLLRGGDHGAAVVPGDVLRSQPEKVQAKKQEEIEAARQATRQRRQRLEEPKRNAPQAPAYVMGVRDADEIADTKVRIRGNRPGEVAPRGVLSCCTFGEMPAMPDDASGRLALARWSHPNAVPFFHTGSFQFTRPSVGSWVLYDLGTENASLPGFLTINPPKIAICKATFSRIHCGANRSSWCSRSTRSCSIASRSIRRSKA